MKSGGRVVCATLAAAFLGTVGWTQAEKQVQLAVKVFSVSEESARQLGASFQGNDTLSAKQHFEKLVPVRDWITKLALSDQVGGQALLILRPEAGGKSADGKVPEITIEGVDEKGSIKLQTAPNVRIDLVHLRPGSRDSEIDIEMLKQMEVKDLRATLDLIKELEAFRQKYRGELTAILEKTKADVSDENRKVADLVRKSVQTTVYQRGVLEGFMRLLRQLETSSITEEEVLYLTNPDPPEIGDLYPVIDLVNVLDRAKDSLTDWETSRREQEGGL